MRTLDAVLAVLVLALTCVAIVAGAGTAVAAYERGTCRAAVSAVLGGQVASLQAQPYVAYPPPAGGGYVVGGADVPNPEGLAVSLLVENYVPGAGFSAGAPDTGLQELNLRVAGCGSAWSQVLYKSAA